MAPDQQRIASGPVWPRYHGLQHDGVGAIGCNRQQDRFAQDAWDRSRRVLGIGDLQTGDDEQKQGESRLDETHENVRSLTQGWIACAKNQPQSTDGRSIEFSIFAANRFLIWCAPQIRRWRKDQAAKQMRETENHVVKAS
jgi:hypothetical protein